MQTAFSAEQLVDPEFAASHAAIRKCVHCGFCTATCPTYVLLGDERDSPRGRIELIKAMLEDGGVPSKETVTHVDRCLSCLACTTTCPSGVDYAQLIDHGRTYIEQHYRRPLPERWLRALIPAVLTRPGRLAAALALGRFAQPFRNLLPGPLAALLRLVPGRARPPATAPATYPPQVASRGRVALLQGCVEPAMAPSIRDAAIRLITRAGFEVVLVEGEGCCGALSEHLGRAQEARAFAAANVRAWTTAGPFDAIVTTAAGCGTALKGYGHLLRGDGDADLAASLSRDILEFVAEAGLPPVMAGYATSACVFVGSMLRPIGGGLADRLGGVRTLTVMYIMAAAALAMISFGLPHLWMAIAGFVIGMGALGMGNGAVFQLAPQRFGKEIGVVTGQ